MTSKEFEQELKAIDPGFSVVDNPSRIGLSNILYNSTNYDLPVISRDNIKDEIDNSHRYEFPNGMSARLWARPEIVARIKSFLTQFKGNELKDVYEN